MRHNLFKVCVADKRNRLNGSVVYGERGECMLLPNKTPIPNVSGLTLFDYRTVEQAFQDADINVNILSSIVDDRRVYRLVSFPYHYSNEAGFPPVRVTAKSEPLVFIKLMAMLIRNPPQRLLGKGVEFLKWDTARLEFYLERE